MADELQVSIEKLVYGGEGLAHAAGKTVFTPFVLPGETLRVEVKSRKKNLLRARPVEITAPSAKRVAAPCPHFQVCGGCHYQHIDYDEQVRQKTEILRETLARLGGISWTSEIKTHTGAPYGYRNRAQWAVRDALPRALGYFFPESSSVLPIDECAVLSPLLQRTFARLQDMARSATLPSEILEIESFADSRDTKLALNVAFRHFPAGAEALARTFREALPELESLLLLDRKRDKFELTGPGYLIQETGGFQFQVNHLSFFQVNRFLLEELLQAVVSGAKGATALDLYAGVGFFTLPLARTFRHVVSVDANLAATRDLRTNAEAAGLAVTSHSEHAEEFLKKTTDTPDFVVLDPPRAGLGPAASVSLMVLGPAEIAYLSCDPATLVRDLSVFTHAPKVSVSLPTGAVRYEIAEMHLFDLFPQTYHIETLVRLRRAS
jgi:23S rRNA (uracil1939-C5)-methyltransferase